jgi:hypothetical protein
LEELKMARIFQAIARDVQAATAATVQLTAAQRHLHGVLSLNEATAGGLAGQLRNGVGTVSGGSGGSGGGGGSFLPVANRAVSLLEEIAGGLRRDSAYASLVGHS